MVKAFVGAYNLGIGAFSSTMSTAQMIDVIDQSLTAGMIGGSMGGFVCGIIEGDYD
jgi:hypothetical protein